MCIEPEKKLNGAHESKQKKQKKNLATHKLQKQRAKN